MPLRLQREATGVVLEEKILGKNIALPARATGSKAGVEMLL